jgi:hypothetical protein
VLCHGELEHVSGVLGADWLLHLPGDSSGEASSSRTGSRTLDKALWIWSWFSGPFSKVGEVVLLVPYALLALKFTEGRGEVSAAFLRGERRVTAGVDGMSCSEMEGEAVGLLLRVERLVVDMMNGCGLGFLSSY